jgi:hypothetical protein
MAKKKKNSAFVWILLIVVIVALVIFLLVMYNEDPVLSAANRPRPSQAGLDPLTQYQYFYDHYTEDLTDEELTAIIDVGMDGLSNNDQNALSSLSDQDLIEIARGTETGYELLDGFSEAQTSAANNLLTGLQSDFTQSLVGFALMGLCTDPCEGLSDGCHGRSYCKNGVTMLECPNFPAGNWCTTTGCPGGASYCCEADTIDF